MQYPKQSTTVHVENLNGELSIYDWRRLKVHNLNPTAARVWELCDGETTPQEMAAQLPGDLSPEQAEELVWMSLKRLEKAHLLENKVVQPAGRKVYTRREMLTGLGIAAVMLPVVSTIMAPGPVAAQSGGGGGATCPITRTVTGGTITQGPPGVSRAFTPVITAAEIAACNPTQITISWTGDPTPNNGNGVYVYLQDQTNDYIRLMPNVNSPQSSGDSAIWTAGNRPYDHLRFENGSTDWNAGNVTVTLS